ncbi:MAG: electron transfer flavoprotein subunit beta/FixA family protein [Oscillospiraceae bacterium]|nr:electron transfer flavoprotein subunit beta/FixA family protein [Oscillospiraceae bacterium]
MNILVCLKLTAQARFSDSLRDGGERLDGGQVGINPADLYALELALRAKEKTPGAMVTVVAMAPDAAEHYLRDALAMGADRAVLVSDRRIAGSDTLVTARILAAAVRRLPAPDLILCGKKSIDSETGHVGPQLSVLLSLPLATNVLSFELTEERVELLRAGDRGQRLYTGPLPCVLTVCNGNEMVRQPSILGLRRARSAEITRLSLDDLGVAPEEAGLDGSPTRTVLMEKLRFRSVCGRRVADPYLGAQELAALLRVREEAAR